jgi:Flp pilus assembly protein TadG
MVKAGWYKPSGSRAGRPADDAGMSVNRTIALLSRHNLRRPLCDRVHHAHGRSGFLQGIHKISGGLEDFLLAAPLSKTLRLTRLGNGAAFVTRSCELKYMSVKSKKHQHAADPAHTRKRPLRALLGQRRASAALEFAIIMVPFTMFLLGIMELSYDMFVQGALDSATATLARQIQIGTVSGITGQTNSTTVANALCGTLGGLLNCNLLVAAIQPIPSGQTYSTAAPLTFNQATSGTVCTGLGGQAMQIGVWYTGPSFVGFLVPSFSMAYKGSLTHLTHSSAGFVNEYFGGGQSGTGC